MRAVKRISRPYRRARVRLGYSRRASMRFALRARSAGIGTKGWLPRRSWLSIDGQRGRDYPNPGIKQYYWRGRRIWQDKRALRELDAEAVRRFNRPRPSDEELRAMIRKPSDEDMQAAIHFADEMGWTL